MSTSTQTLRPAERLTPRAYKPRPVTMRRTKSTIFTKYIGRLHVAPQQQIQMSLGVFGTHRPLKGFSVNINPDPDPDESVVAEILSTGSDKRYELILNVANFGDHAVIADVWQM